MRQTNGEDLAKPIPAAIPNAHSVAASEHLFEQLDPGRDYFVGLTVDTDWRAGLSENSAA